MSVNKTVIDSDAGQLTGVSELGHCWFRYGFSPLRHQPITLTNVDFLSMDSCEKAAVKFEQNTNRFIKNI